MCVSKLSIFTCNFVFFPLKGSMYYIVNYTDKCVVYLSSYINHVILCMCTMFILWYKCDMPILTYIYRQIDISVLCISIINTSLSILFFLENQLVLKLFAIQKNRYDDRQTPCTLCLSLSSNIIEFSNTRPLNVPELIYTLFGRLRTFLVLT